MNESDQPSAARPLVYRPLRAPRGDGEMLVEPSFDAVGDMVRENVQLHGRAGYDFGGRSLADLARQARADLLRDAVEWTSAYRDVGQWKRVLCGAAVPAAGASEEPGARRQEAGEKELAVGSWQLAVEDAGRQKEKTEGDSLPTAHCPLPTAHCLLPTADCRLPTPYRLPPIFLAGHQPQLFHPGVWLKNFALGALAQQHGAVAVNLVVDSDTARSVSLRVPGGSVAHPHATMIPYDAPAPVVPYEERAIVDRRLLEEFDRRVLKQIDPLVPAPLVESYWLLVRQRAEATGNLGASLAQARHQLEGQWGLQTLEIPQSRVCDSAAFRWFTGHILAELPRFHTVYNAALAEYRRVHGIRNAAQPMPDLAAEGPWLEAPFWVWSAQDPQRRHLFARRDGERIVLRAGGGEIPAGSAPPVGRSLTPSYGGGERGQSHFRWGENRDSPLKIRSRALITTLWARLVLGDLFLHGIGGAKYDQLTDLLIERFFGLAPPGFMVLSATLHLPVEGRGGGSEPHPTQGHVGKSSFAADEAREIAQRLRQLTYHPERFLASRHTLIAEKARWIATRPTRENARARCRAIRDINDRLQPFVAAERAELLRRQEETARGLQAASVLAWREYGFCLYPEETLRKFFAGLLPKTA